MSFTQYAQGIEIVDSDNDGIDDIFIWNILGSLRILSAEIYEIVKTAGSGYGKLELKVALEDMGQLNQPRFVRHRGVNYLVTAFGGAESLSISHIERHSNDQYRVRTVCNAKLHLEAATKCRHPVCKKLARHINDRDKNDAFGSVEWTHKNFPPEGISIFFGANPELSDFDNTQSPESIWKLSKKGGKNLYFWDLLGLGNQMPTVPPPPKAVNQRQEKAEVMQGKQHDRLRRVLEQQSKVFSTQLNKDISLPSAGKYFLYGTNNRIYWVWDFDEDVPYGKEMHIAYTRGTKSDYIGNVGIRRSLTLEPCVTGCNTMIKK